jgi:hypothetical protein
MVSKLGIHIIEPYRIRGYDQAIVNAKPCMIKVVGAPNELGILHYYHDKIGDGTIYVARVFDWCKAIGDMFATKKTPGQAADVMYSALVGFVYKADMSWCWFECGPNEPGDDAIDWLDNYYASLIPRLRAAGIKSVSYHFSVCHPPLAAWSRLGKSIAAIRAAGGGFAAVGLHQYGLHGNMQDHAQDGDDARVLRHRCIRELDGIPKMILECGLDEPAWQDTDINTKDYMADWKWLDYELRKDADVLGAVGYTMDHDPEWSRHRIDGECAKQYLGYIAAQNATIVEIPPVVEPPAGLVAFTTQCEFGQNIRDNPSYKGDIVGELKPGEMAYTSLDERLSIGQDYFGKDKSWIYAKKADGTKGWMAVWLTKQVA